MNLVKSSIPGSVGYDPPDDLRAGLMALVRRLGEHGTMKAIDVDRMTLARVIAGFSVSRGTLYALTEAVNAGPKQDERQLSLAV